MEILEESYCMVGGHADNCQCHITHKPIYNLESGITHTDWRYIELKGYMFTGKNCFIWGEGGKKYELKAGVMCMNCHNMIYYDKCANDECYNFYMYCNYKHIAKKGLLDDMFWEIVYKQHPNLKEEV